MFDKAQFDEEMRKVRRKQTDDLAAYLADYVALNTRIRELTIDREISPETLKKIEETPIPRRGRDPKEVADDLVADVFQNAMLTQHPRFFSFVASAVSPYSLAGSLLTDIYNLHGGGWSEAPGACLIEEKIIKWMAGLAGYDTDRCGGVFVSGGSMANMSSLIAARDNKLKDTEYNIGVAYISDQTHSSVAKGLRLIGFRNDQIVVIPTDDEFRMQSELLEEAIIRDQNAGKKPFAVIGTLGTTNTGSIDPLSEIGDICQRYGLWFHVDGAYGSSILISDIFSKYAKGIEKSDSFSWDAHKWSLQTYSCSCYIAKDRNHLLDAFTEHPEYLDDVRNEVHADPWDLGPEMSRPHRAIKLWFTLQAMGTDRLADVIDYSFYNANRAAKCLLEHENWEIISRPMCGAFTFRYAPEGYSEEDMDALTSQISQNINDSGYAFIVTTQLKGKRVLRMCLINGNTTEDDVINTIEKLDEIAKELING